MLNYLFILENKEQNVRRIMLIFIVLVTASCFPIAAFSAQSTKDVTVSEQIKHDTIQKALGGQAGKNKEESEYIIGTGDVLSVSVYGEGSMSAASIPGDKGRSDESAKDTDQLRTAPGDGVQVRIDGRISLKHLGDVRAVGLTPTQLADALKALYATVFSDPVVTVVLLQGNSQRYTVMGKVAKPGVFYIDYPITLVQVIARCGGFTEWAKSEITLVRKEGQDLTKDFQGNTLRFDYSEFLAGKKLERNILVKSGDIIIVP